MDDPRPKLASTESEQADNTEMIRRNIQHTRAEIGETIHTLQDRLSPERVKEEMKSAAREQMETAKEKVRMKAERWQRKAAERILNNPIPAAMVGVGLIWMFKQASCASQKNDRRFQNYYSLDPDEEWPDYAPEEGRGREPHSQSRTRDSLNAMKTKARESGQQVRDQVSEWADQAQDSLEEWKTRAYSQSEKIRSSAQEGGQRVKGEFRRYLHDNPLTVGAVTLAIGAAVGLSLPRTQKEDQWLGETRDRMVDQAKATAKAIIPKTKEVVGEMTQAVQDSVKDHMSGHAI